MKIIFTVVFSLSSSLLLAQSSTDVEVQFAESENISPLFGTGTVNVFIAAIGALFLFNSARILLDPESGNKTKGLMNVIIGLVIMFALSRFL